MKRRSWVLVWLLAACAAWAARAQAQEPSRTREASGGQPVLPLKVPRPLQGTTDDQRWDRNRHGLDAAPVNRFVDSLQASDAVIRLVLGQGRILTTKAPIVQQGGVAVVAVGDPTIADFDVLPNPRMIRLIGKRPGITDLTLVTSDNQTLIFELHVQYNLPLLQARMRASFPSALVKISQLGEHLILEGQARDQRQITMIESTLRAFLESMQVSAPGRTRQSDLPDVEPGIEPQPPEDAEPLLRTLLEATQRPAARAGAAPQIINLMNLPGVQQVLLQVRVAELNRTGLREIGADTFFEFGPGNLLGTQIGGGAASLQGLDLGTDTTAFGIFPTGRVEIMLRALRQNSLIRVLAEPNLVALSGHEASFLAGGEFPVPVPQGGANLGNVTVQFKDFGVQLNFVPHILDDESIRLEVRPEVSTIDESLGTTLVVGGDPVPGINTRRVHTTVQLREGESLALAGLLQVTLDANTTRIPGLGDLPYLGPLFSNTSHRRVEKELLVLVTPYLVSPLNPLEVPPLPGDEVQDPNDLEFYLLNRIEGRTGREHRSTTTWDDPLHFFQMMKLERDNVCGPVGFAPGPAQLRPQPRTHPQQLPQREPLPLPQPEMRPSP